MSQQSMQEKIPVTDDLIKLIARGAYQMHGLDADRINKELARMIPTANSVYLLSRILNTHGLEARYQKSKLAIATFYFFVMKI